MHFISVPFADNVRIIVYNTVKLVYKNHPRDQQNVVFIYRWSLYAGSIAWKVYT